MGCNKILSFSGTTIFKVTLLDVRGGDHEVLQVY